MGYFLWTMTIMHYMGAIGNFMLMTQEFTDVEAGKRVFLGLVSLGLAIWGTVLIAAR